MWEQEDSSWEKDETCPVVAPAIVNLSWTSETIQKWKNDRHRKYPTLTRQEKASKIKQILSEKRAKLQEIYAKKRTEHNSRAKKVVVRRQKKVRKYGDFVFPDCDVEEEGVKQGIFAFGGTKLHEKSQNLNDIQESFNISDDEDILNGQISDSEPEVSEDEPPEMVKIEKSSPKFETVSKLDEAPETLAIQKNDEKVDEPPMKKMKMARKNVANFPTASYKDNEINNDYLKVLRGPKRDQTFLEKLLENEILKEKYEILQCINYVCSKNFFSKETKFDLSSQ